MDRQTHTIDATNQSPGRLAAKIAVLLRGKQKADFAPYKDAGDFVVVQNAKDMRITGRKLEGKVYYRHSGYLGGLKQERLKEVMAQKPDQVLRLAVLGMLPKNRLRALQIKRLKIES